MKTVSTPAASTTPKRRRKKGKKQQQKSPSIAEASRIQIRQILEQFRVSNDQVYTFEANLTNFERAEVHELCKKMGMKSKSSGSRSGNQRRVSVYKFKRALNLKKENESLTSFTFSEEGKMVLRDLFTCYPPDDHEVGEKIVGKRSGNADTIQKKKDDILRKPAMNKAEIAKKLESVASRMEKSPNLRQITKERSKLPIASYRDVITSTVESHQVVLISGETGCGKTTQVPQYLLDYMWNKGETCKIVCTQPRRISATSVAERISSERGENIGDSVGYKIRLESKGGKHSSIVFCTNGVLLRVLVTNGSSRLGREASGKKAKDDFSDITHIIVDEIHERDRFSDFMLAIIRDVLPLYPHLRLVKTFFLEDVLSIVKSTENHHLDSTSNCVLVDDSGVTEECRVALDDAISLAWSSDEIESLLDLISSGDSKFLNFQHTSTRLTPLMVFAKKGRVGNICMLLSLGVDCHLRDSDGKTALEWAEQENQKEAVEILRKHVQKTSKNSEDEQYLLDKYMSNVNPELIDVILIEQLLMKICADSKEGAILAFLPGWDDINRAREKLSTNSFFKDSSRFLVLALHSMVPSMEQKKVFKRPPAGCRKIILSTNIAETAITIDDVVYVIDSGRMKEKSYDPYNNVSTLQSSWISKASAKQREGRAGRCQPGNCYHLYSKLRASSLPDFQVPEIKRMPIEELCLQVKLMDPDCKIDDFLKKTLDPPVFETIHNAITVLQEIGALSSNEELTELGAKLGSIPVHPLTSKMLFFAILLNCLDPALTLACASDYRDPFTLPLLPTEKKKASAAKSELASLYGGHGDQLAVIAAYECWKRAKQKGEEARFCSQYFVSSSVMNMLFGMRKQLLSELFRNGFIPEDSSQCSINAEDSGIIHAVLVAGLYPMVGRLLAPHKNGKRLVVETTNGEKVRLHPHSANFQLSFKRTDVQPLVIYDEITRGDGGLHIRNCSVIGPLPLLLLATEIAVAPGGVNEEGDEDDDDESDFEESDEDEGLEDKTANHSTSSSVVHEEKIMSSPENTVRVVVDRWLSFESTALDIAQIYCLRERLSAAILFKITHPEKILPELLGASMHAIACILSYDGLAGMKLPLESVDSLTSMVKATEIGQSEIGRRKGGGQNPSSFLRSLIAHGKYQGSSPHYHKVAAPLYHHAQLPLTSNPSLYFTSLEGSTRSGHGAYVSGSSTAPRGDYSLKRNRGNKF